MDIYAIMVVYNSTMHDSVTYSAIQKQKDIKLIVCDNSTKDFGNRKIVEEDGYVYLNMNGNVGLSKAYNTALDYIQSNHPTMDGYVIILDDDTHIPNEYFDLVRESIQKRTDKIYLPVVKDIEGKIGYLSPYIEEHRIFKGVQDINTIPKEKMCGINSGMVISLDIFKSYRYDERIFLDFIDHNFMHDMKDRGIFPSVMHVNLLQEFSSNNPDKHATKIRYKIFKKDVKAYYSHDAWDSVVCMYVLFRRKLGFFLQFKDIRVFGW